MTWHVSSLVLKICAFFANHPSCSPPCPTLSLPSSLLPPPLPPSILAARTFSFDPFITSSLPSPSLHNHFPRTDNTSLSCPYFQSRCMFLQYQGSQFCLKCYDFCSSCSKWFSVGDVICLVMNGERNCWLAVLNDLILFQEILSMKYNVSELGDSSHFFNLSFPPTLPFILWVSISIVTCCLVSERLGSASIPGHGCIKCSTRHKILKLVIHSLQKIPPLLLHPFYHLLLLSHPQLNPRQAPPLVSLWACQWGPPYYYSLPPFHLSS